MNCRPTGRIRFFPPFLLPAISPILHYLLPRSRPSTVFGHLGHLGEYFRTRRGESHIDKRETSRKLGPFQSTRNPTTLLPICLWRPDPGHRRRWLVSPGCLAPRQLARRGGYRGLACPVGLGRRDATCKPTWRSIPPAKSPWPFTRLGLGLGNPLSLFREAT